MILAAPVLRVYDDTQPIDFTYQAILDYHGRRDAVTARLG
jgi:hypothetical protein